MKEIEREIDMIRNHSVYDGPEQPCLLDQSAALIASAERELGAFLSAVRRTFGSGAARRAAECWMEALEAADVPPHQPWPDWRTITIAAASRLAHETFTERLVEKAW